MATIHGLSINGGKLDVQLSDSQFSKDSTGLVTLTDAFIASAAAGEVAKVIANAPEDYDTLKKIADYIASDKTGAAQLNNAISALQSGKMDKLGAGDGISFLNNVISVKAGQGLEFYGQEVKAKLAQGLKFNNNDGLTLNVGTALNLSDDGEVYVPIDNKSLQVIDDKLKVQVGAGLETLAYGAGIGINCDTNSGLAIDVYGKLTLQLGSGLETVKYSSGKGNGIGINIDPNCGLRFYENGRLAIGLGQGIACGFDSDGATLMVHSAKIAGPGLTTTNNLLKVNVNNGFQFDDNNKLEIKPGNGIYVNNIGVNVRPNEGIAVTEAGVSVKYGTGLAIDENGYLYVDVAQLAKTSN